MKNTKRVEKCTTKELINSLPSEIPIILKRYYRFMEFEILWMNSSEFRKNELGICCLLETDIAQKWLGNGAECGCLEVLYRERLSNYSRKMYNNDSTRWNGHEN